MSVVGNFFGKAEISNLENVILYHNVGGFKVPMDNTFPDQGQETVTYLSQHVDAVLLIDLFFRHHDLGNISITHFLNDVVVFAAFHHINELHDVGVMD